MTREETKRRKVCLSMVLFQVGKNSYHSYSSINKIKGKPTIELVVVGKNCDGKIYHCYVFKTFFHRQCQLSEHSVDT